MKGLAVRIMPLAMFHDLFGMSNGVFFPRRSHMRNFRQWEPTNTHTYLNMYKTMNMNMQVPLGVY